MTNHTTPEPRETLDIANDPNTRQPPLTLEDQLRDSERKRRLEQQRNTQLRAELEILKLGRLAHGTQEPTRNQDAVVAGITSIVLRGRAAEQKLGRARRQNRELLEILLAYEETLAEIGHATTVAGTKILRNWNRRGFPLTAKERRELPRKLPLFRGGPTPDPGQLMIGADQVLRKV